MKFADGSEIRVEDGRYIYDEYPVSIIRDDLHEFFTELVDRGIVEQCWIQKNGGFNEYFGLIETRKEVDRQPEEPDLEACYERVIEDLANCDATTESAFDAQMKTLGVLTKNKNAISNQPD